MRLKKCDQCFETTCTFPKTKSIDHQLEIIVESNIDVVKSKYKIGNYFKKNLVRNFKKSRKTTLKKSP